MTDEDRNTVSKDGSREWQGCDPYNGQVTGDVSGTITCFVGSSTSKGPKIIDSKTFVKCGQVAAESYSGKKEQRKMEKASETEMREAVEEINREAPHQQDQVNYHKDAARTLAAGTHGSAPHLTKTVIEKELDDDEEMMTVVRRLTPTECSRLQGFTEGHLDCMGGDSAKYRSAGNSWAVPCAYFNIARMHIVGEMMKMVYATVCSGVEAHSQAVKDMGDEAIFFSEIEKPQSHLLATRYPNVPNCGDFTKIHYDEAKGVITNALREGETDDLPDCFYHAPVVEIPFKRGGLDLLSGGIPCFIAGTRVRTANGEKNIEDVKIGDMVLTHRGRYRRVNGVMTHLASEEIVVIKTTDCKKIECTPNHPFYADLHNGDGEWVDAGDLNENWRLCAANVGELKFVDAIAEVSKRPGEDGELVYNLSVDFDESYVVEGYAVHNCTDVSVAGKREGMKEGSGTRSSLAFNYQKLIDDLRPTFILYENVPGIFSSNSGRDFIWFVYKMMNAGYSIAWRTLDAQYCMTDVHPRAVPQRRRRLWLIGYKGDDWRIPARVVFEPLSALGEEPPKRIPGKGFQTLNPDYEAEDEIICDTSRRGKKKTSDEGTFFDCMFGANYGKADSRKIAILPDAKDFGDEADITKVNEIGLSQILAKFGKVGYCGDVFCGDKEPCTENIAEGVVGKYRTEVVGKKNQNELLLDFGDTAEQKEKTEEQEEIKTVQVLAEKGFIGNAGVMSKGKLVTMECHEWTSGIQLSPKNYKRYMNLKTSKKIIADNWESLVKEGLVPDAYDGTVCGLSDILEDDPDPKYNLSWKACYGILKRAENRGKVLPEPLKEALVTTIVESAPLVKWISLNAKKDVDRAAAKGCYDEYIEEKYHYADVVEEAPAKKADGDEDEDDDELEDEGIETGNGDDENEMGGFEYSEKSGKEKDDGLVRCADTKLDASRVETETSPTILATSFKEPPMIVKKEERFPDCCESEGV